MSLDSFSIEVQELLKEKVSWTNLISTDPREKLLLSGESFTVYRTLTDLLDLPEDHPDVIKAHEKVLHDPQILFLLNNLSDWEVDIVKAHNKPSYLPNQLWLLFDFGIKPDDDPRIMEAINKMLAHQDPNLGQFLAHTQVWGEKNKVKWTSVLCDHHIIVSVLLLAGLKDNPIVKKGLKRMNDLLTETTQGWGWKCIPWLGTKQRGPGRVNDVCPMLIVDALRGYWILPKNEWPKNLIAAGKTLLNCWLKRAKEKPYMFGHGRKFRMPRAPFLWYNIGTVLDATSHYPELVKTQAFHELIAVSQIAFNEHGEIIPKTVFRDFKNFSFGQKKEPSPWMTFFFSRIFKRAIESDSNIIKEVKKIDGKSLKGSIGGPKAKKNSKKPKKLKKTKKKKTKAKKRKTSKKK
ncbi:MAG: hypothetical protein ACTSO9_10675 [Candidatus Helarchaeota archaeon]